MSTFLLVHPPLLGPAVWQPGAELLRQRGHQAIVPDLRATVANADGWWERYADECARHVPEHTHPVVVGHSGSGVALPLVVTKCSAQAAVFVDALVPDRGPVTEPGEQIRAFVQSLEPTDGRLPVWTSWWPPADIAELLPGGAAGRALVAEQPALPADFYDYAVPVPPGWEDNRLVRYLQLSPAYDGAAREAAVRGWPVQTRPGTHLDLMTKAAAVVEAIVNLST